MITPTPRAMSPQDIVRIYVPPAPFDERKHNQDTPKHNQAPNTKDSKPNNLPVSEANNIQKHPNINNNNANSNNNYNTNNNNNNNNSKTISNYDNVNVDIKKVSPLHTYQVTAVRQAPNTLAGLEHASNRNSIIYGSGDLTPVHCAFNRSDDDLVKSVGDASLSANSHSLGYIGASSSSRRGSLSRKSPSAMFESNLLMECSHMIKRRLSNQSNSSINFDIKDKSDTAVENISKSGASSLSLRLNSPGDGESFQRRMTSFEQLAASRYKDQHSSDRELTDKIEKYTPTDDEENYSYSYYKYRSADSRQRSPTAAEKSKRFVSENNVQYESISMRRSSKDMEYHAPNKQRPNSSGNETSLFQYETFTVAAPHKTTSIKEYKRFYGTSNDDTCDDEHRKSSDESSSSPNGCKSVLNSPETVPLLPSSPSHGTASQIPIAKLKSPASPTYGITSAQLESPTKPSRIPIMYSNNTERKMSTTPAKDSPTAHISPNSSELNRILPPIEVISSSSSSNNSLSSRKLQKTPTSPNGQTIAFSPNRPTKLPAKNGTAIGGDSNTIRIKVNQSDK